MLSQGFWKFILIAIILGVIFWNLGGSRLKDIAPFYTKKVLGETAEVKVKDNVWQVEVAKTADAHLKGLSGRKYLANNQGMLFVFSEPGIYPFTMKDTYIPLDIIWIKNAVIVYIVYHASPGEELFNPGVPANYVLEVKADTAEHYGWQVGDEVTITFDNN